MTKLIYVMALTFTLGGCMATKPMPQAPESVGTLTPSYRSISVVPVHATTDLTYDHVVDSGEDSDATAPVKATTPADDRPDTVKKNAHGF
jgi:hypothetical protein